ncbi:MAG: hypothetical protein HY318_00830 [Armatimonadetes bacterium]|nr:hypothetical protein [Armatimonadota bacterium]
MKASLENLRPMSAQDILDIGFRLYRSNFWLLVKVYAVLYVPCNVGLAIIMPFVGQNPWLIPLAVLLYLANAP